MARTKDDSGDTLPPAWAAQIINGIEDIKCELKEIRHRVEAVEKKSIFENLNPWFHMQQTSRSRTKNLRASVLSRLGIRGDDKVPCWVTGEVHGPTTVVKVAHILPDSTNRDVLNALQLSDDFRNDVDAKRWNFMLLREDLEAAFDSLEISFVPVDRLHTDQFILKVWAMENVAESVRSLEGRQLNVPSVVELSRRALSYQTACAYAHYARKGIQLEAVDDFSSDFEGKDETFASLRETIKTSIHEELLEDSDGDEDDFAYDD